MFSLHHVKSKLVSWILGTSAVLLPFSATAAEQIAFNIAPFGRFEIEVDDLETFLSTGEVSDELAFYFDRLSPQQIAKLPELLSSPLEFAPLTISKFSNSSIGSSVLENFGKGIKADVDRNGFYALRGAIIAAAFDERGLTIINLLRKFPSETIYLDYKVVAQYLERGAALAENRQTIDRIFFTDSDTEVSASNNPSGTGDRLLSLQSRGAYTGKKRVMTYNNPYRPQRGYFDLYLPTTKEVVPLVVISHGLASNRQTFAYLAEHLASYGFAVAVVEHDGISREKFDRFFAGAEPFPEPNNLIYQPLDIKYVLDRLSEESKVNTQQVGIIGQSFGGYTALALAGGELTADPEIAECQSQNYRDVILDLSTLAQCSFNQLGRSNLRLRDTRIKAVIAINPMAKIFGASGMKAIEVPTVIVSGTNDLIMPPVAEQIKPFSWLKSDLDKYLVLVKPGTHFSFLQENVGVLPIPNNIVGPDPASAHPILQALSTAFFQVYLAQEPDYRDYLTSDRVIRPDNSSFELLILRSLNNLDRF